jgi:hypothetical protein
VGEVVDGLALLAERIDGEPARGVGPLHHPGVVNVGALGDRPFEHPEVRAAGFGDETAAGHLRLRERAGAELAEGAVVPHPAVLITTSCESGRFKVAVRSAR